MMNIYSMYGEGLSFHRCSGVHAFFFFFLLSFFFSPLFSSVHLLDASLNTMVIQVSAAPHFFPFSSLSGLPLCIQLYTRYWHRESCEVSVVAKKGSVLLNPSA